MPISAVLVFPVLCTAPVAGQKLPRLESELAQACRRIQVNMETGETVNMLTC